MSESEFHYLVLLALIVVGQSFVHFGADDVVRLAAEHIHCDGGTNLKSHNFPRLAHLDLLIKYIYNLGENA